MAKKSGEIKSFAKEQALYPKEAPLMVAKAEKSMTIGVPVEKELQENRVSLVPQSVSVLVNNGHEVVVEKGAGEASKFSDREYSEAGAKIVYSREEVFQSQLVFKVEPPNIEELSYMNPGNYLMSAIQMANVNKDYLSELNKKKISALAFEFMQDKGGQNTVVRSMSEIAGKCIVSIAADYLSNRNNGMGVVFGGVTGVPPTKVVILGAGTIGEVVAKASRAMGAQVRVFDNHHYKLRRLKYEVGELYTAIIDPVVLAEELRTADVVVGALRGEDGQTPCVVTEDMVQYMKPDAIIIDASISQGGCFETSRITTHDGPTYKKYDVIHYCVPNIPSRVSRTASIAISNIFTPILLTMGRMGGFEEMMRCKPWFRKGMYAYKGYLTFPSLAKRFNMPLKDLDLLVAARF